MFSKKNNVCYSLSLVKFILKHPSIKEGMIEKIFIKKKALAKRGEGGATGEKEKNLPVDTIKGNNFFKRDKKLAEAVVFLKLF